MSRQIVAAIVAVASFMQVTGCTYRSLSVRSDQLREPGIEVIKSVISTNGDTLSFDEMPYTRIARVLGDTIYAYVEGKPVCIALHDIVIINVERPYLIIPVKATRDILESITTTTVKTAIRLKPVAERFVPYLIPVAFVLIVVKMEKG